jgi:hypothetical protein
VTRSSIAEKAIWTMSRKKILSSDMMIDESGIRGHCLLKTSMMVSMRDDRQFFPSRSFTFQSAHASRSAVW